MQNTAAKGIDINIQIPFNHGDIIYLLKKQESEGGLSFSFEKRTCERIDIAITDSADGLVQTSKVKLSGLKYLQEVEDCHTDMASVQRAIEAAELPTNVEEDTDANAETVLEAPAETVVE